MISVEEFNILRAGGFAALWIDGPAKVDGFAATDPDDARFLRIDGLTYADFDQKTLARFSLRLERKQIAAMNVLTVAPKFPDAAERLIQMLPAFWTDLKPTRLAIEGKVAGSRSEAQWWEFWREKA